MMSHKQENPFACHCKLVKGGLSVYQSFTPQVSTSWHQQISSQVECTMLPLACVLILDYVKMFLICTLGCNITLIL